MNHYLRQHPEIFITEKKELHFFGKDLGFKHDRSESSYQDAFSTWDLEKVGGEASVWYLYSKTAAREIFEFNPEMKIIVMIRNPADMVHAQHGQAMFVGRETITDFESALDAEQGRKSGQIPTHRLSPKEVFFYSQIARYTEQIQRFIDVFGREKVHIIVFDDLKLGVQSVYAKTLKFLNVDPSFLADLTPRNQNRKFKNKKLHYLVNNPNPKFKRLVQSIFPDSIWRKTKTRLQKVNTIRAPRDKMTSDIRRRLIEMYQDEVQSIGSFLGRDLSSWLETGEDL